MAKTRKVEVHVTFSDTVRKDNRQTCSIDVASDGSDSVWDVKCRIAVGAPLMAHDGHTMWSGASHPTDCTRLSGSLMFTGDFRRQPDGRQHLPVLWAK